MYLTPPLGRGVPTGIVNDGGTHKTRKMPLPECQKAWWCVRNSFIRSDDTGATKEQVILNRLLIGHTDLTHSYLLNKEQPPNCNYCKSLLTAEHILTSCSAYNNIREKHDSNSQLPHILTNISEQHIFNCLSEINFFKQTLTFSMARYVWNNLPLSTDFSSVNAFKRSKCNTDLSEHLKYDL